MVLAFGASSASSAFHDGGVASCGGCHVLHESVNGQPAVVTGELLGADSASDLCLGCHATSVGAVFGADPLFPATEYGGGNFIFLLEDNINDDRNGSMQPVAGEAAGHSVVAPGSGLFADSRNDVAPGGSFPSASLGCTSCHDPHGNTSFRMLYGAGPVQGGLYAFSAAAPDAEGIDLSGGGEGAGQHSAYRSGWTAWCGNCHGSTYHENNQSRFDHPASAVLGTGIAARYNVYAGEANPTGGSELTAWLNQVPFEEPASTTSSTAGPAPSSRLGCMSCHRAHATSAPAAGRWDFQVATLGADGAESGSFALENPYLDPAQKSLCLKCHDVAHDNEKPCLNCHAAGGGASKAGLLPTN